MSNEEILKSILTGLRATWQIWALLALLALARAAWWVWTQRRLHRSGINEIDEMSGLQFEQYLEWLFGQLGYRVERTKFQGDFGADLVISKDGAKIAVQAKLWKRKVSIKAVQEAVASAGHYKCQRSMVVTNSSFTKPAIELARDNKVDLWDRNRLVDALLKAQTKVADESSLSQPGESAPALAHEEAGRVCAGCGSPISQKAHDYCLEREARFGGKVYCYQCQRRPGKLSPQGS